MDKRKLPKKKEHKRKIQKSCRNAIVVHHINGNHFDDRPENRILLTVKEHTQIHIMQGDIKPYGGGLHKGCKGTRLGVKLSEETKRRISKGLKGKHWKWSKNVKGGI